MTRIAGLALESASPEIRAVFDATMQRFGILLTPISVAAHSPEVLRAYISYEVAIERAQALETRLKYLAAIKVAALVGCPF
jgi:hypothetical protein